MAQLTARLLPHCKTAGPTACPKWGDISGRNSPDLQEGLTEAPGSLQQQPSSVQLGPETDKPSSAQVASEAAVTSPVHVDKGGTDGGAVPQQPS